MNISPPSDILAAGTSPTSPIPGPPAPALTLKPSSYTSGAFGIPLLLSQQNIELTAANLSGSSSQGLSLLPDSILTAVLDLASSLFGTHQESAQRLTSNLLLGASLTAKSCSTGSISELNGLAAQKSVSLFLNALLLNNAGSVLSAASSAWNSLTPNTAALEQSSCMSVTDSALGQTQLQAQSQTLQSLNPSLTASRKHSSKDGVLGPRYVPYEKLRKPSKDSSPSKNLNEQLRALLNSAKALFGSLFMAVKRAI